MGGGQGNPLMVLLAPSVQKELKLKEDQKAKIYAFVQKANQKNRDLRRPGCSAAMRTRRR